MYLATASSEATRNQMQEQIIGQLITPNAGNKLVDGAIWALDNGCFGNSWSEQRWLKRLEQYATADNCLFAVVPDVVGDAVGTARLWERWFETVKQYGYRAAFVTQNGCAELPSNADALFTGGDNDWKLGSAAHRLVRDAKRRGLWCHMGRVNSRKRFKYAFEHGYDSVDGTFLAFGPDTNLPKLLSWVHEFNTTNMKGGAQ